MDAELRLRYPTALEPPQGHGDEPHVLSQSWLQDACSGRLPPPPLPELDDEDPAPSKACEGGLADGRRGGDGATSGGGSKRAFRRLARRRTPAGSEAGSTLESEQSQGSRSAAERFEVRSQMDAIAARTCGSTWETLADWDPRKEGRLATEEASLGSGAEDDRYARQRPRSAPGLRTGRAPVQYDCEWPSPPRGEDRMGEPASSWYMAPSLKRPSRNDPMSRGAQMRALWSKDRFLRGQRPGARKFDLRGCGTPPDGASQRGAAHRMMIPSYVPPHERRRDALRLQVRHQMLAPDFIHA